MAAASLPAAFGGHLVGGSGRVARGQVREARKLPARVRAAGVGGGGVSEGALPRRRGGAVDVPAKSVRGARRGAPAQAAPAHSPAAPSAGEEAVDTSAVPSFREYDGGEREAAHANPVPSTSGADSTGATSVTSNSVRSGEPLRKSSTTTSAGTSGKEGEPQRDEKHKERAAEKKEIPEGKEDEQDPEVEPGFKMTRVCDRLLEVFWLEKPEPLDWRKLLAFSEEWAKIRPHFYARCRRRAELTEDPGKRADLYRLNRRLKEVDDDMERHNELLAALEKEPAELDSIVVRRRKDFTGDFFEHLKLRVDAAYTDPDRRQELVQIADRCLSALAKYDELVEDQLSLETAQNKFNDILHSPSLADACQKIDKLAATQQLDSSLMLLMTKAWAAAKESNMVKEEAKDIMYHLYLQGRKNMQRTIPPEVRIMRHLLSIVDPHEQLAQLYAAFAPGEELEGNDEDTLVTTPQVLHKWVKQVLDAYNANREGTLMKEVQKLMKPEIITRLVMLKETIEREFL